MNFYGSAVTDYSIDVEIKKLPSKVLDGISWENREILHKWMKEHEVKEIRGGRNNTTVSITGWGHCGGVRVGAVAICFTCKKQLESDYDLKTAINRLEGLKKFVEEKAKEDNEDILGPLYKAMKERDKE